MTHENDTIPKGLCQCGCGGLTRIAAKTDTRQGLIKGKPKAYIKGHRERKDARPLIPCACCGKLFRRKRENRNCSKACSLQPPALIDGDPTSESVKVPLSGGMFALIDRADADRVGMYRWHASKSDARWYARTKISGAGTYLHRFILNAHDPKSPVDHENGDGLDCRRANIRISTTSQNMANTSKRRGNNPYKGVHRARSLRSPWKAEITHNYRSIHLGQFATPEDAARAYDAKARELFGEFARLNFPDE